MTGDETTRAGVDDTGTGQDFRPAPVVLSRDQRRQMKRMQRRNLRRVERHIIRTEGKLPRE